MAKNECRWLWGAVVAVLAFSLLAPSAQAKKVYVEPDEQVADCADQCNVVKMQCRSFARDQHQYCKNVYQQRVREFNWCRQTGGNFCMKPDRCPIMQTKNCTNNYDACFVSCGGIIEDSKKQKKKKKERKKKNKETKRIGRDLSKDDDPDDN